METTLKIALCALMFINLGCIVLGQDVAAAPSSSSSSSSEDIHGLGKPEVPGSPSWQPTSSPSPVTAVSMPGPSLDSPSPAVAFTEGSNTSTGSDGIRSTSSTSNNTHTTMEMTSVTHIPSPPKTEDNNEANATGVDHPVLPPLMDMEGNPTEQSPPQPPLTPSVNPTATSHTPLTTTTINPPHTAHAAPAETPLTTPPTNTPHPTRPQSTPPPTSPFVHPTHSSTGHPKTHSPTSAHVSEPSGEPHHTKPETTVSTSMQPTSASSPSAAEEVLGSQRPSLPSPQATANSDSRSETSSGTHSIATFTPQSNPSAQAKTHADTPSQLNVGGDATVVHEPPALDPLLAGLVSAFIITAIVITLLLFLKLHRRDNRPEFRRLQDLPMDDMMEDTPLSMYSY